MLRLLLNQKPFGSLIFIAVYACAADVGYEPRLLLLISACWDNVEQQMVTTKFPVHPGCSSYMQLRCGSCPMLVGTLSPLALHSFNTLILICGI